MNNSDTCALIYTTQIYQTLPLCQTLHYRTTHVLHEASHTYMYVCAHIHVRTAFSVISNSVSNASHLMLVIE
jgi:hypothetical protein